MLGKSRYLGILVVLLGVVSLAVGIAFVAQGQAKANFIKNAMREEQVSLAGLGVEGADPSNLIDSAAEAQKAADTIKEHRHGIAATYEDLLAGGRYDPTNPRHLSYTQAINLENYLYLGVAGLGVTTVVIGVGVFMIVVGVALGATGVLLHKLARRALEAPA